MPVPSFTTGRLAGAVAAIVVLAVIFAAGARLLVNHADETAIGGPFQLVDQRGRSVTEADFKGRVQMIYFGYSFCPDVCPTALVAMSEALDLLSAQDRADVVPIFITVDPARDTVERMADYVANFAPEMVGLTGSQAQIDLVMRRFRVFAKLGQGQDGVYSVEHSSVIYIMDRKGRFSSSFTHLNTADEIAGGLRRVLR